MAQEEIELQRSIEAEQSYNLIRVLLLLAFLTASFGIIAQEYKFFNSYELFERTTSMQQQLHFLHEKMKDHLEESKELRESVIVLQGEIRELNERSKLWDQSLKAMEKSLGTVGDQLREMDAYDKTMSMKLGFINEEVTNIRMRMAQLGGQQGNPKQATGTQNGNGQMPNRRHV